MQFGGVLKSRREIDIFFLQNYLYVKFFQLCLEPQRFFGIGARR
jgi:hypothetical protein